MGGGGGSQSQRQSNKTIVNNSIKNNLSAVLGVSEKITPTFNDTIKNDVTNNVTADITDVLGSNTKTISIILSFMLFSLFVTIFLILQPEGIK